MQSDAELVRAVKDGQAQAFAALVRRYERAARAVALDVLRDHHSARDATQDAFVRAYENLGRLRKAGAFGPWLMKITRRCALNIAQRMPKEKALEPAEAFRVGSANGPLDEEKRVLLAAVTRLPESEKQVVMLRYFCGHSVKEVAAILGRSVGTVTKQLSRAHKRLRGILERSANDFRTEH